MKYNLEEYQIFCYFHFDLFYSCINVDEINQTFDHRDIENKEDRILISSLLVFGPNAGYEQYEKTKDKDRDIVMKSLCHRAIVNNENIEKKKAIISLFQNIFKKWYSENCMKSEVELSFPFIKEKNTAIIEMMNLDVKDEE